MSTQPGQSGWGPHSGAPAPAGPQQWGSAPQVDPPHRGSASQGDPRPGSFASAPQPRLGGPARPGGPQNQGRPYPTGGRGVPSAPRGPAIAAKPAARRLVASPILLLWAPVLVVIGMLLPWYSHHTPHSSTGGASLGHSGDFNVITLLLRLPRYGVNGQAALLLVALALGLLAAGALGVIALVALLAKVRGRGLGIGALVAVLPGLVGTIGVLVYYFVSGQSRHNMGIGVWVYSLALIPAFVGSIGLLSKKF